MSVADKILDSEYPAVFGMAVCGKRKVIELFKAMYYRYILVKSTNLLMLLICLQAFEDAISALEQLPKGGGSKKEGTMTTTDRIQSWYVFRGNIFFKGI